MMRKILTGLLVVVSVLFFQATDCGMERGKIYVYYPSFSSQGTKLHIMLRTGEGNPVGDSRCRFVRDNEPDTAIIGCSLVDSSGFDTTVVFTDSTVVIIDGEKALCSYIESSIGTGDVLSYWDIYVHHSTNDTFRPPFVYGYFKYFKGNSCEEYDSEIYQVALNLYVRSDSPYVWIRPVGYNAVFVSPETTAYLIDDTFPFVEQDSFRLTHRRIVRFHIGKYYHHGAVELVPGGDSGWARLRVSFSVVPGLGWTMPPEDGGFFKREVVR